MHLGGGGGGGGRKRGLQEEYLMNDFLKNNVNSEGKFPLMGRLI